jgi:uncharacterized repeat protein (TIGR01451 family)
MLSPLWSSSILMLTVDGFLARSRSLIRFATLALGLSVPILAQNYVLGPHSGAEHRLDNTPRIDDFTLKVIGSGNYALAGANFYMKEGTNPGGNVTLTVYDSQFTFLSSATLTESQFCAGVAGNCQSYDYHIFTFTSPVTLPAGGSIYTLRLTSDSAPQQNRAYFVKGTGALADVTGGGIPPTIDLTISKSISPDPIATGGTATYTITVSNLGSGASSELITVTDALPANLTTSSTPSGLGWDCRASTPTTVNCMTSSSIAAAPGSAPAITVPVIVGVVEGTSVSNTVTVSGGGDVDTSNNSFSLITGVNAPNLTVSKSASPSTFTQGQSGSYLITASNIGTGPSSGPVTVTESLPTGVTWSSFSGTGWSCPSPPVCTYTSAIAAGTSAPTLTISVNVTAGAGTLAANLVTVSGGGDVDTSNNSFSLITVVTSVPGLQITSACPASPQTQGTAFFESLTATGGSGAFSWSVVPGLPNGLSLAGSSVSGTLAGPAGTTSFSFIVQSGNQTAALNCSLTVVTSVPGLQITGSCPANLALPFTLSIPLTASGGSAPYSWGLSGPDWMSLSGTSGTSVTLMSGTPDSAGPIVFAVTLTDSAGSAPATLVCNTSVIPVLPRITVTVTSSQDTLMQPALVMLQLASSLPLALTGTANISFTANAFGITDNPQVYFNGGSRQASFTLKPGETSIFLPSIQEGTVAGTIHIEIVGLMEGGVSVLPDSHPFSDLTIPRVAPVITNLTFANETPDGFDILISGYSTPRDMKNVTLTFGAAQGGSLTGQVSFTIDLTTTFSQYYNTPASQLVGSLFQLHVPVSVSGDKAVIGTVGTALSNSAGTSPTITESR